MAGSHQLSTSTDLHLTERGASFNSSESDDYAQTVSVGGDFTWRDIKNGAKNYCNGSAWRKRVPFTYWLPKYNLQDFRGDMVAGLTVGLTIVPQALAYVGIAELPLEMGLYSSFMCAFVYAIFGTSKDVSLGPTSVISLLTAASYPLNATLQDKINYAVLLSFYSGFVQLLLGIFNLGFLVNFVSEPVVSGFTSASAFVIMYGQLKSLIGVKFGRSSDTVIDQTIGYIASFKNISGWDTLLGVVCVSILLVMKDISLPKNPRWGLEKRGWSILAEIVRTIRAVRYGIVIVFATILGYYATVNGWSHKIALTGNVKSGLPTFEVPNFAWGNHTFTETFTTIIPSVPFLVLVGCLEAIAVAKALSSQFHYKIVPSQELIALGLANIVGSFFHAYPITGAFSRSSLAAQSGMRTQMGCVWTGAFVLMATAVISQVFKYVPKAALSAVIITAVLILFDFKIFKHLWLVSKKELIPVSVTIIISFTVGVDYGILAGVGASLLLLLYPIARPAIVAQFRQAWMSDTSSTEVAPLKAKRALRISVAPQGALYFPSAEYLKDFLQDYIVERSNNCSSEKGGLFEEEEIVFDGTHLANSDYTTLHALRSVVSTSMKAGKKIHFLNTPHKILHIILPKEAAQRIPLHELQIAIPNNLDDQSGQEKPADSVDRRSLPRVETSDTVLGEEELMHVMRGQTPVE